MTLTRWYVVSQLRKALEEKLVELLLHDYDTKTARKKAAISIKEWAEDASRDHCLYSLYAHM